MLKLGKLYKSQQQYAMHSIECMKATGYCICTVPFFEYVLANEPFLVIKCETCTNYCNVLVLYKDRVGCICPGKDTLHDMFQLVSDQ